MYRFPEPRRPGSPGPPSRRPVTGSPCSYADGPHDAEALLIDARNGDLVIITKVDQRPGHGLPRRRSRPGRQTGRRVTLEAVGTLGEPASPGLSQRLARARRPSASSPTGSPPADANAKAGVATVRTYAGSHRVRVADADSASPTRCSPHRARRPRPPICGSPRAKRSHSRRTAAATSPWRKASARRSWSSAPETEMRPRNRSGGTQSGLAREGEDFGAVLGDGDGVLEVGGAAVDHA